MRQLGRYRLDARVGSGAFATVWRGHDPELDHEVAVKVLAENWIADAQVCERFLAEARLLRRISHPAVVRVHDVGTERVDGLDRPYFVMDLVHGGTLAEQVGTLAPREALLLAAEAAEAVQALHDAGVVHRDLKPSNLLVDASRSDQQVLVADLGSAKLLAEASVLTLVTGTPAYMAPEQAANDGPLDSRVDVYAMGVVAYQLLSGSLPHDGMTAATAGTRPGEVPPRIAEGLGMPRALDDVLASALARNPEARFASCADLAQALRDLAAGRDVVVPGRLGAGWPAAAVAAVGVLLFVVAAWVCWLVL